MKKRMRKQRKPREHSLFLKAFRIYLQYVNSGLYFRKEHIIGLENVPADGTPVVVVSNHQNCLNDPLCVCLMLTDRRMNFIARANVFKNPVFNKALRAMGLLPAYRMSHEGFSAINKNRETMDDAGQALTDGETLMLYPEADHQDKRWLGKFKIGYLRIAFEAAEKMNFEQDVMVLPSCNHYSNYFHARTDMLIKFDRPISLKPYYERYKESPRETMMEINQLVRSRILDMMLHVEDLEHYDEIDFLRETGYGFKYATEHGFKPRFLPSRLISDQQFVAKMQTATKEQPEKMEPIYEDTKRFSASLKELGLRDWLFRHNPGIEAPLLRGLGLLLLLPLYILSIIPTCLMFIIPKLFIRKLIKDKNPDCEFVIVAPMLPNYEATPFVGAQSEYYKAIEQLEEWSVRCGCEIYRSKQGADPSGRPLLPFKKAELLRLVYGWLFHCSVASPERFAASSARSLARSAPSGPSM